MTTPNTHTNQVVSPITAPKQLSSKAKLFSIVILLIAIVGTSAPFIHMVFPKETPQEVQDLRAALKRCEITEEEYRNCRLEQREIYTWFGHYSFYEFLFRIGLPLPVICCTLMILYSIRYIGEIRVQRTLRAAGSLLLFSGMYSFLYSFSRRIRESVFIFHHLDFERYGHLVYYHLLLVALSLCITILCVQLLNSKNTFAQKIKTLLHFIIRTRTQIIAKRNTSTIAIEQPNQKQFDQKFYNTLARITVHPKNSRLLRYKTLILRSYICFSILGSIVLLAYPLHPNSGINEYISIRTAFWDGKINQETLVHQKRKFFKKHPYDRTKLTNRFFIRSRSHPLGLTFSLIILFLILPFIHEKHAKRGILITAIAFSIIALFYLRWAFFPFENGKKDYHINYYYAMMSISTVLIILVVYQFIQSTITYKYKMMELIHFMVGARKQLFNALKTHPNPKEIAAQQEQFDEEFYETLDKVTKK